MSERWYTKQDGDGQLVIGGILRDHLAENPDARHLGDDCGVFLYRREPGGGVDILAKFVDYMIAYEYAERSGFDLECVVAEDGEEEEDPARA